MSRPSEKAAELAEELLDYVHRGMSRAAVVREVATMIDESNQELLEGVEALLADVQRTGSGAHAVLLNHLRTVLVYYQPFEADAEGQHELFSSNTQTQTRDPVSGRMP